MDKTVSQLQLYQYFLGFFLPKGILDFFELVWVEVVRDSLLYRDRIQTVTVEVEKKLTWWQSLTLKVGGMALLAQN